MKSVRHLRRLHIVTVIRWILIILFVLTACVYLSQKIVPLLPTTWTNIYVVRAPANTRKFYTDALWEAINKSDGTPLKPFSFARHGKPLLLYSRWSSGPQFGSVWLPGRTRGNAQSRTDGKYGWNFSQVFNYNVDCSLCISGDKKAIKKARERGSLTSSGLLEHMSRNGCEEYISEAGYIQSPLTQEEREFPLAYSILVYTSVEQVELLLRAIYRPQNIYCIHVDSKSPPQFRKDLEFISSCFKNVFLTSRSVDVRWGTYSVLEPELICMEELWNTSTSWKYIINLTGQEFPLRTNYELVKILTAFNSANNVEGSIERSVPDRWRSVGAPPHNVTPVKGGIHVTLTRAFVDHVLHNKVVQEMLTWSQKVSIPDELFFPTLNHNPQLGIPGSYKGIPESDDEGYPFLVRYKNWDEDWHCHGTYVHDICVFGVEDLPVLATREEMFANKFHADFEPATLLCLYELLYNRTHEEYAGHLGFNDEYYRTRDFVWNHV